MAAIVPKYRIDGRSINQILYAVFIYDLSATYVTPIELTLGTDILINTNGDDRDLTETITTGSCKISVLNNIADSQTLLDDLISSNEGRFYIEILYNYESVFTGRVISNGLEIEDRLQPFFSIEAIDGLTLLKTIEYVHPSYTVWEYQKLNNIFLKIINKIDTVEKIYDSTTVILKTLTALSVNDAHFTSNILDVVHYANYFYTYDNEVRKSLTYWDVLDELLKRHNMKIIYAYGIYYIIGKEIYTTAATIQYYTYRKDEASYYLPGPLEALDITPDGTYKTLALAGGTYYHDAAVKSVEIVTEKYHTSKSFGNGMIWLRTDTTYVDMAFMLANTKYASHLKFNIQQQFTQSEIGNVRYIKVRLYFRSREFTGTDYDYPYPTVPKTNFGTSHYVMLSSTLPPVDLQSSVVEESIDIVFSYNTPADFNFVFIMPEYAEDRVMAFRTELVSTMDVNFNVLAEGTFFFALKYKITQEYGQYPLFVSDVVKFYGETDTEEVVTKQISILAPDTYGSDLSRPILWSGTGNVSRSNNNWRFDTIDSYESLERAIIRNLLKNMGAKQKFWQGTINMKNYYPKLSGLTTYRDESFFISSMQWNVSSGLNQISMIKIPTVFHPITVNIVGPKLDIYANQTQYFEDVLLVGNAGTTIVHDEFINVTDSFILLDAVPFSPDYVNLNVTTASAADVAKSWDVHVNGVKYRYIDWATTPILEGNQWTFDVTTNKVLFAYTLESDFVEIKHTRI